MNHPILIWNIRGIGNNKSIRCIKSHLRINCVQLACIIEPKVAVEKMDPIRQRLQFDSVVANNDDNAKIWFFGITALMSKSFKEMSNLLQSSYRMEVEESLSSLLYMPHVTGLLEEPSIRSCSNLEDISKSHGCWVGTSMLYYLRRKKRVEQWVSLIL